MGLGKGTYWSFAASRYGFVEHPRHNTGELKTWMAGTSPAMTGAGRPFFIDIRPCFRYIGINLAPVQDIIR
jgi:hypothetical protein